MAKSKQKISTEQPDALFGRVVSILEQAQSNVVRAVNTNMVLAYWLIGREIVQELQGGQERAEYGKKVITDLSGRLTQRYGQGYSPTTLQYFRKFYLAYLERCAGIPRPVGVQSLGKAIYYPPGRELIDTEPQQGFSPQLTWSHYRVLMRVDSVETRDFYEREAIAGGWDKRTLERQIYSYYYERTLKSVNPAQILAEGRKLYDGLFTAPDDNPTIGLILCTEKSETVARYSVLNDRKQIFASKYMLSLPTEEQWRLEIERERRLIEAVLEDRANDTD